MLKKKNEALDRKANPQRYRLSSGAKLMQIFIPNYMQPSLHIWTKAGDVEYDSIKFQRDYKTAQAHYRDELTNEEFVNFIFESFEQINAEQANILRTILIASMGGSGQAHIGIGRGGSNPESSWGEKDKRKIKW